jgi:hypothetical protein
MRTWVIDRATIWRLAWIWSTADTAAVEPGPPGPDGPGNVFTCGM